MQRLPNNDFKAFPLPIHLKQNAGIQKYLNRRVATNGTAKLSMECVVKAFSFRINNSHFSICIIKNIALQMDHDELSSVFLVDKNTFCTERVSSRKSLFRL